MQSRFTFIPIVIIIVLAVIYQIIGFTDLGEPSGLKYNVPWAVKIAAILLIIQDGTLFKSKVYRNIFIPCVLLVILGAGWKILHWAFADILFLSGFTIITVAYTAWFIQKQPKVSLDFLKWAWVLSTSIALVFTVFHRPGNAPLKQLCNVFLLVLLLAFLRKIILLRRPLAI